MAAGLLLVGAASMLVFATAALRNLGGAYKDSSDSTYVLVGVAFLAISAVLAIAAGILLLGARRPLVGLLCVLAALASGIPFPVVVGATVGWPLQAGAIVLALTSFVSLARS